jgi:low affinity Fe/Cu permease
MERFTQQVICWVGSSHAFTIALVCVLLWALTGPLFHFSDTWQLIINTSTTIITFLMVFLLQRAQNKDALALHLKLNEVIAALRGASNRLIDVESLSEQEVLLLQERFRELAARTQKAGEFTTSHSVEERLASKPLLNGEK